jgi:hypothetical protein
LAVPRPEHGLGSWETYIEPTHVCVCVRMDSPEWEIRRKQLEMGKDMYVQVQRIRRTSSQPPR